MAKNNTKFRPRFIDLASEKINEVAALKHVTPACVRKALRYDSDSALSVLIRNWALDPQNGGVEYAAQKREKIIKVLNAKGEIERIIKE